MKNLIKTMAVTAMMMAPAIGNAAAESESAKADLETQYVGEYSTGMTSLILWDDKNFVIRNSAVSVMGNWSIEGNRIRLNIMDFNDTNDGFVCVDTEYFDIQNINGVINLGNFEKIQR